MAGWGQNDAPENAIASAITLSPQQVAHIMQDMMEYISQVEEIETRISTAKADEIKNMQNRMQAIDVQWQAYTSIEQVDISTTASLMDLLSHYQLLATTVNDSLTTQLNILEAVSNFNQTKEFLTQCKADYDKLSADALQYSLVPQTGALLAEVKAKEALLFAQVTESYKKAVEASQLSPQLAEQMPAVEQQYLEITQMSEKIKATAYKTLVERIKDYVLTFAGLAIILIFFNFVVTKIKAAKQASEMAKKYKNMLNPEDDIPTI